MINEAILVGHVGKKEVKTVKNDVKLTLLSVATTKRSKDFHGNKQELTTWHYVNCFHKLADVAEKYVHVGDMIYLRGEINNKRIDSGDRVGQYFYSITAHDIKFILPGKKREDASNFGNYKEPSQETMDDDSEVPF